MMQKCSKCGREMDETLEYVRNVNHGLDCETIMCEDCFDSEQDRGNLVSCEACGEWFTTGALHDVEMDETHTFTACPCCSKDVVSGQTRDEMTRDTMQSIKGVGGLTAKKLAKNGYGTLTALSEATADDLSVIDGIGEKLASSIITQARQLEAKGGVPLYEEPTLNVGELKRRTFRFDPYRLIRSTDLRVTGYEGDCFLVKGGRDDHIVRWNAGSPICDCADFAANGGPCKHILCVRYAQGDMEVTEMLHTIHSGSAGSIRRPLPYLWYRYAHEKQ